MAHGEVKMSNGDFVWVATGKTIYVDVGRRAEFDKIEQPFTDNGEKDGNHVLVKTVEQGDVTVIFRHWIKHRGKVCAEEV